MSTKSDINPNSNSSGATTKAEKIRQYVLENRIDLSRMSNRLARAIAQYLTQMYGEEFKPNTVKATLYRIRLMLAKGGTLAKGDAPQYSCPRCRSRNTRPLSSVTVYYQVCDECGERWFSILGNDLTNILER